MFWEELMINKNSSNKKKVLMVQGLHEEGKKLLLARDDIEPITIMSADENEILEAAKDVHGITVRTANISRKIIENSKNLKVVSRHGVGYDSVDVDALNDCNIPLAIAAHSNMISVAEHAMFMLLALSKNVFYYDEFARKADWTTRWNIRAWDLAEKSLLVIGYGRIGSKLVKRALAFDMNVYVYDPYVDDSDIKRSGGHYVDDFRNILPQMDAVTLHCPKTKETTDMFSVQEFDAMKSTSILINCARGGIVNEKALYDALTNNKIRSAGLDVYDDEPSTSSNPLFGLDNILLSPHIAGVTQEATIRMSKQAVQNVLDVFDNKVDPDVIINKNVL
jgi:D-3-phosphoglycerate dehydrogenase